jgi:phenylalanine-4-hydroxylase
MRSENLVPEESIRTIFEQLKKEFSEDWLLNLELYEVALQHRFSIQEEIHAYLLRLQNNKAFYQLIENGLNLLNVNSSESKH